MRLTNAAVHLCAFLIIFSFGDYNMSQLGLILMSFVICCASIEILFLRAKTSGNTSLFWLLTSIVVFYIVAYPVKFALGVFLAEGYWVVPKLITAKNLMNVMPEAYFITTVGLVSLIFGLLLSPFRGHVKIKIRKYHFRVQLIFWLSIAALIVKYLVKNEYNVGVPGLEPSYLGIPYLAGFLALVFHAGTLLLFNLTLFFGLLRRNISLSFIGLTIAFINALIDLRFGSKSTVIYQIIITGAYLYMLRSAVSAKNLPHFKKTSNIVAFLLFVTGSIILSSYRFMNSYRYAILDGYSATEAISVAMNSDLAASKDSYIEVFNRLIGIETLGALIPIGQYIVQDTGFISMVDGSFVDAFTEQIIGHGDAMTKFSVTQFAYFYFTGGYIGLIFGFVVLGFIFTAAQSLVSSLPVSSALKIAFLPVLWILFVNILMGGGNFFLTFKELAVVFFCFFVTARCAVPVVHHSFPTNLNHKRNEITEKNR